MFQPTLLKVRVNLETDLVPGGPSWIWPKFEGARWRSAAPFGIIGKNLFTPQIIKKGPSNLWWGGPVPLSCLAVRARVARDAYRDPIAKAKGWVRFVGGRVTRGQNEFFFRVCKVECYNTREGKG